MSFPFDWMGWTAHTLPILNLGTRLGRYEIHSLLGAGGMGEVYLAWDTRLDRKVALKILPDPVAGDPDRMMRFAQEAKAASGLNHPNIITIYEIDQSESTSFIATEFIDGSTLRERMRAQPITLCRSAECGGPGRGCADGRACQWHRAPRHQAGKRHHPQRRHRQGAGLRAGEVDRSGISGLRGR